jgi:flagellar L-ring protein precursor FlgH
MILAWLVAGACVPHVPDALAAPVEVVAPPPVRAAPGSLYSEVGSTKLTGADANARRVGDLITVLVDESSKTQLDANTSTSRSSSAESGINALLGLDTSILRANPNMGSKISLGGSTETATEGAGSTGQAGSVTATLTCHVTDVLPNGNLKIRGTKEISVNRETQFLVLEGVIRPRDIQLNNTIRSSLIAEARVQSSGRGVVSNQQQQGWGTAVVNSVMPF